MRSTESILVRPFNAADANSLHAAVLASINELCYWMPWCHPGYSLAEAKAFIEYTESAWANGVEYPLGVFDVGSGEVIGGTGLNHINRAYKIANLGYWVCSPRAGRGIARTAARFAAEIGFQDLQFTRLEIVVLTNNHASQKVAHAVGARLESTARNRLYFQGSPREAFVNALIPTDLIATHNSPPSFID